MRYERFKQKNSRPLAAGCYNLHFAGQSWLDRVESQIVVARDRASKTPSFRTGYGDAIEESSTSHPPSGSRRRHARRETGVFGALRLLAITIPSERVPLKPHPGLDPADSNCHSTNSDFLQ
jgi:hypothetical protein